jgi:hypothetical protein
MCQDAFFWALIRHAMIVLCSYYNTLCTCILKKMRRQHAQMSRDTHMNTQTTRTPHAKIAAQSVAITETEETARLCESFSHVCEGVFLFCTYTRTHEHVRPHN